ncbi:TPA: serine/threonine protein kinase [Candidatus Poribacteria bacterium]|nr:serine/threonine protein kinase [Candidatus Poribacteria bacterium]
MLRKKTHCNKKTAKTGCYHILEVLSKGAFGTVYKAKDEKTGTFVAIKVLDGDKRKKAYIGSQKRKKLRNHPNLVAILDDGVIDDTPYIIMEFVPDAVTLSNVLTKLPNHKMALNLSIYIILQISDALLSLHQQGFIHTDVSPSNILIVPTDARILLIDYADAFPVKSIIRPERGTLPYVAPEMVLRYRIQPNADIFSLGVIFYQVLTGRLPFDVAPLDYRPPTPPHKLDSSIPLKIDSIILKAIEINPDRRYRNIQEFRADLTKAAQQASLSLKKEEAEVLLKKILSRDFRSLKDFGGLRNLP